MNIEVNSFNVLDDKNFKSVMNELYGYITKMFNLDSYLELPHDENIFFKDTIEYPSFLIHKINGFCSDVFTACYKIPPSINLTGQEFLFKRLRLMSEQLTYLYFNPDEFTIPPVNNCKCKIWFIIAKINHHPYGGIFLFQNIDNPEIIMIQGISKFIIPSILEYHHPNLMKSLPHLNSLLQPEVEKIANDLKVKEIWVNPIGKQGDILERHYGYAKSSRKTKICDILLSGLGNDQWYVKTL